MSRWSFVGRTDELTRLSGGGARGPGTRALLQRQRGHRQEPVAARGRQRACPPTGTRSGSPRPTPPPPACRSAGSPRCCRPTSRRACSPAGLLRWAVDALHRAGRRPAASCSPSTTPTCSTRCRRRWSTYVARVRERHSARHAAHRRAGPATRSARCGRTTWSSSSSSARSTRRRPPTCCRRCSAARSTPASVDRLWQLSAGQRAAAARAGASPRTPAARSSESYGMWRWTGRLELAPSLDRAHRRPHRQAHPAVRAVLELVAFGEPIGLPLLVQATDLADVEIAEERQLIRVVVDDRRTTVRLAHPLYGEVVRRRCPVTRIRRLLGRARRRWWRAGRRPAPRRPAAGRGLAARLATPPSDPAAAAHGGRLGVRHATTCRWPMRLAQRRPRRRRRVRRRRDPRHDPDVRRPARGGARRCSTR